VKNEPLVCQKHIKKKYFPSCFAKTSFGNFSQVFKKIVTVPDTREVRCLGPKGSGNSSRGGDEGGPSPPNKGGDSSQSPAKEISSQPPTKEISSQAPARKEATWRRRRKKGGARGDKGEPACTE
jgi:hypothetical protein